MKLFVATPISTFTDPEAYNAYRKTVVQFVSALRTEHEVSCDIDGLETKAQYVSPEHAFHRDFSAISKCDAFILHYPAPTPTSALIELGYAIALNKPIIMITPDRNKLPYLVQTLDEVENHYCIIESNELGVDTAKRIIEVLSK